MPLSQLQLLTVTVTVTATATAALTSPSTVPNNLLLCHPLIVKPYYSLHRRRLLVTHYQTRYSQIYQPCLISPSRASLIPRHPSMISSNALVPPVANPDRPPFPGFDPTLTPTPRPQTPCTLRSCSVRFTALGTKKPANTAILPHSNAAP